MKTTSKILAIFLLFLLGFGGIYGAIMLISDPSGGNFEWSLELLKGTPFDSFLIPGIVLLIANGIFPIFVAIMTLEKKWYANTLIILQGIVVIIWLWVQVLLNPDFFLPLTHYPSFSVGFLLVILALIFRSYDHHRDQTGEYSAKDFATTNLIAKQMQT